MANTYDISKLPKLAALKALAEKKQGRNRRTWNPRHRY